ncbi:MAG: hypothetical protein HC881_23875 [Leptolyngbyaceae cyanobacterium SL_7_1]|nr:hypothetical protein [Leptolyngbyaceae cyanobacterium SL_7_1]
MESSIDFIAHKIAECIEKIEDYKREISRLRQTIRDLSYQAVETDEGEIAHFNDID